MSYVEIKEINGRKYKYLRKSVREGNKIGKLTIKYLGPVNPVYKIGKKRKKTNASVYIRVLSEAEKSALRKATKSTNAFIRDRAKIILLSSERYFAKQIAEKISCDARKVRNAVKAFNKRGLKALQKGKAKGAAPKFKEITKKIILMHFAKEPMSFGYHYTTWTLPRFRNHLMDYNVVDSISIETIRQIIIKAGAKLTQSKRWQYSPDPDFEKKNKKLSK